VSDPPPDDAPVPADDQRVLDLVRENRLLERGLRRMETNLRRLEEFRDSTSSVLSKVLEDLETERSRSHQLLLNVLPQRIIDRLNAGETVIADHHPDVTVVFTDFVGFTSISAELAPATLIEELNTLYSAFDAICAGAGIEKIKTIGDAFLAVAGLPGGAPDHVAAAADAALRMCGAVAGRKDMRGGWRIRIGLDWGPVVAGVIGSSKFAYDVWGATVNLASRLEGASEPGRITVSAAVAERLSGRYELEPRGELDLKGLGEVEAWYLVGAAGR
jgi:class 3 adenylate cyclase